MWALDEKNQPNPDGQMNAGNAPAILERSFGLPRKTTDGLNLAN
jgi:hypothetical protein